METVVLNNLVIHSQETVERAPGERLRGVLERRAEEIVLTLAHGHAAFTSFGADPATAGNRCEVWVAGDRSLAGVPRSTSQVQGQVQGEELEGGGVEVMLRQQRQTVLEAGEREQQQQQQQQ